MNEKLLKIQAWFLGLKKREQWLVGITAVVGVAFVWHTFFYASWAMKNTENQTQIDSLTQRIDGLNTGINAMKVGLQQDPDKETKERIARLQAQISDMDRELRESSSDLISPRQMAHVLEDVLKQNKDLTLIRIQSGAAEPVFEEGSDPESGEDKASAKEDTEEDLGPLAYRHPLEIEFKGGFKEAVEYLRAIEGLEWQFFWEGIALASEEYPTADIRLRVYTLSLDGGWIGG